jgi:hypothetical protein
MELPLVSLVMMTWATVKLATMLLELVAFSLKGMMTFSSWKYILCCHLSYFDARFDAVRILFD